MASVKSRTLVVGSRGRGGVMPGDHLGSVAMKLATHARCPVVVVRGEGPDARLEQDPVVVGVDSGPHASEVLAHAFEEADLRRAPLTAVHTYSDTDTELLFGSHSQAYGWERLEAMAARTLAEALAGWAEKYPDVRVGRVVRRDRPRTTLLELGQAAQLVVVGSRGRGGFAGLLLGSTSQSLIHHASCPVMVVPAEGRHRG